MMRQSCKFLFLVAPVLAPLCLGQIPDREKFGESEHPLSQVPMSAFEVGGAHADKLKIEVWAQSPQVFTPVAMDLDAKGADLGDGGY